MASQIRNLLVKGKPDDTLVMPGLLGVKEIVVHDAVYKVLDGHDRVVAVFDPEKVSIRVNIPDLELKILLKNLRQ